MALVVVKAVGGALLHSSSLIADAGHSAADILSDILTLGTISYSLREPNARYPLGYGKVETLGAIGVSALLCKSSLEAKSLLIEVFGGIGIGMSSLDALMATLPPDSVPSVIQEWMHAGHIHSHSHMAAGAHPLALWIAGGSIGIKEWLFRASTSPSIHNS